ncbi:MAG TPA: site-2 protease family protein [Candidatus Paceibacterota bacterium]|nr:site-2 protease family protein [Candidatus Paceibacterota bacterium]
MLTFIIFLIVISVLVLVHEAGHFIAAKRAGMKVEEFGFGFPPRLVGWRHRGTVYSINLIPFGGFVRIFGENGENRNAPGSFGAGSFFAKVGVVVSGVAMNFLLAVVLLILGSFLGLRVGIFDSATAARATQTEVQILQVAPGSPAETAKLQPLDTILGFRQNGDLDVTATPEDVQTFAYAHEGEAVTIVIGRGGTSQDIPLHLRQPLGPTEGPIGISLALTGVIRYPWYESIWRGIASAGLIFWGVLVGYWSILKSLIISGSAGSDITGPVGIATLTGQAARVGFNYLMQFVAMISVNLAVLNILPFPALDGGRLAIIVAEKLRGRSLSAHVEEAINAVGFAILIMLMIAVTIKDIVKFF